MPKPITMQKPTHFIVIDDDAICNMMCKFSICKYFGNSPVTTFQQPEAALVAIKSQYDAAENRPTILFLDIHMPSMNGWDFLETFARFPAAIAEHFIIYILSSSTDKSDIERASAHPLVSGFISKPITEIALKRVFSTMATSQL
jgi:CheY-like chemotaxis protein